MQRLIKDRKLTKDEWQIAHDDIEADTLSTGKWLVPLRSFLESVEKHQINYANLGPILKSDDDAEALKPHAEKIQIIALHFEQFTDGRSFSQARMLRDQFDFEGELRAVGNFVQDQLFYLSRCGFNAFALPDETSVESALQSLGDFSVTYQAASDEPQPLFRRRV